MPAALESLAPVGILLPPPTIPRDLGSCKSIGGKSFGELDTVNRIDSRGFYSTSGTETEKGDSKEDSHTSFHRDF